ncbi:hypothetical protein BGX38DRAFT_1143604 [Terfezia claveryi]|nr:hypothetical protein BGX38DRAFT_1143604 [Terfezia claveryi]
MGSRNNPTGPPSGNDSVSRADFEALQAQLAALMARQTAADKAKIIEEQIEEARKKAYEDQGLTYPGKDNRPQSTPLQQQQHLNEHRIPHKSIGYLRPTEHGKHSFEARDADVYVRPHAWLQHLKTKIDMKADFQYKFTQMQVLCPSKEQLKSEARQRKWDQSKESCWDYVWEKAALFEELDDKDRPKGVALITDILDGLPTSLAQMSRTEFNHNATINSLQRNFRRGWIRGMAFVVQSRSVMNGLSRVGVLGTRVSESFEDVDWRSEGAESTLKRHHMWDKREDGHIVQTKKTRKKDSPEKRAWKSMQYQLQKSRDQELREDDTQESHKTLGWDKTTGDKDIRRWAHSIMPKIPWQEIPDNWADAYPALFNGKLNHRGKMANWQPKSPLNGRDPSDNIIIAKPHINPQDDGRIGSSKGKKVRALLDNCANLYLANLDFLQQPIPDLKINDSCTTEVKGIGCSTTVGYVHILIYIDCMARVGGKPGKVELNLEVHVIRDLPVDMVIGMDTIFAYWIDTIISRELATITVNGQELAFPIEFKPSKTRHSINSQESFTVLCNRTIRIPALHEGLVDFVSGWKMGNNSNAWLEPIMVKNDNRAFAPLDGGWAAPGPISKGQSKILFANFSTHTMVIHRGQAIARLTPCSTQDCFIATSIRHDPSEQGDIAPPEIFSCVPKKGSIVDLHLLRK